MPSTTKKSKPYSTPLSNSRSRLPKNRNEESDSIRRYSVIGVRLALFAPEQLGEWQVVPRTKYRVRRKNKTRDSSIVTNCTTDG